MKTASPRSRRLQLATALVLALVSSAHADEVHHDDARVRSAPRRWSLELGPSVWAASVATTIKLGPVQVQRNVPFAQMMQYFDGGMSGALEVHYDRFTASGGFQFGRLATTKEIADGMGEVGGSLTTVLVEGALGYTVLGGRDAPVSFEVRSGVRHNELDLEAMGTLDVAETTLSAQGAFHRRGTDYLIGARGRMRVNRRVELVATGDTRIAGDSYSTWSVAADVHVRATRWLAISGGWRVLETQSTPMTIRRSGPQLVVLVGF